MKARLSCSPLRGARGFVLASLAVAVALPACGGSTPQPKADVIFTGTNNYTSQTSLKIPVVQTMPHFALDIMKVMADRLRKMNKRV